MFDISELCGKSKDESNEIIQRGLVDQKKLRNSLLAALPLLFRPNADQSVMIKTRP